MLKQNISVKDQFGIKYLIQATVDNYFANTQCFSNLKYITRTKSGMPTLVLAPS